jgi:hypothetical protein
MESAGAGAGTPASGGPAIPAPALAASGADPTQETSSSGSGDATRPCSDRQQDGEASKFTSLNSLARGSDRQRDGDASGSSKKRKRMTARSYIQKFEMDQGGSAARKRMSSRSYIQKFKMDQEENAAGNISSHVVLVVWHVYLSFQSPILCKTIRFSPLLLCGLCYPVES